jgi:outer membrane biosynthesis protein TonB
VRTFPHDITSTNRRRLTLPGRLVAVVLGMSALLASGCIRAQAKVIPEMPALDVPLPPPRVIVEVVEPEPPAPAPPVAEPVRPVPRPRPAPQPRAESRPEPPKGEVPEAKASDAGRQTPTLQTASGPQEAEAERRVRGLLARATADLGHIDRRRLDADARTQFDTAKRFVSQAEDALRAKNLVFAGNLADKAAALAAQLASRR